MRLPTVLKQNELAGDERAMNYRHAFHAGNHADCLKHSLLLVLLEALKRKVAPFAVLDSHAGRGLYDLAAEPARRTGEAAAGVLRLEAVEEGPLLPYLTAVRAAGFPARYPGSPVLIRKALRPQDRLICCELHPEEYAALRCLFGRDRQVAVHCRDGWEALRALTPFPERRGLVLIDPPFEQPAEFARLERAIDELWHRFRAAIIAVWYPIKHRAPVRAFHEALRAGKVRDVVAAELWLREPTDPRRLNGSGVIVVGPPWGFEETAERLLAALAAQLVCEAGGGFALRRLVAE